MAQVIEIQIENLHVSFDDRNILRGIDLTIQRGEVVAIVGGSGCGKTVLLNCILGQLVPDAGRIFVADHETPDAGLVELSEVPSTDVDQIHTHWGVVFQRNALFSGSVYDNIALWMREVRNIGETEIERLTRFVLDSVGLPTDDEFLARDVDLLSGGMAKRLAVARALSMDPLVMFYDEPTTGLDPMSAAQIHDLIQATHIVDDATIGERTTVIITHDKDLLSRLRPRVAMLHDGRIFFDGTHAEFEASRSTIVRPYFDIMPVLHQR